MFPLDPPPAAGGSGGATLKDKGAFSGARMVQEDAMVKLCLAPGSESSRVLCEIETEMRGFFCSKNPEE